MHHGKLGINRFGHSILFALLSAACVNASAQATSADATTQAPSTHTKKNASVHAITLPAPTGPDPAAAPPQAVEAVPAQAPDAQAGVPDGSATFGFYAGETRAQIIAAIGKAAILKQDGDILEVNAAPKPDANFDNYLLIVGPKQGLVKLIATGKDIEEDPTGKQMKAQFATFKTNLTKSYGDPSDTFDFVDAKSTLKGSSQFMMALTKTERTLAVYWTKKDFGNSISSVSVEGNGLGNDKGYLSMEYEFSGYHAYLLSK